MLPTLAADVANLNESVNDLTGHSSHAVCVVAAASCRTDRGCVAGQGTLVQALDCCVADIHCFLCCCACYACSACCRCEKYCTDAGLYSSSWATWQYVTARLCQDRSCSASQLLPRAPIAMNTVCLRSRHIELHAELPTPSCCAAAGQSAASVLALQASQLDTS
jgi:hypothetical protein